MEREVAVRIVEHHKYSVAQRDFADRKENLTIENGARRIRWCDKQDCPGAWRDQRFQLADVGGPATSLVERPLDRLAAARHDLLNMRGEAGIGEDDLISVVQDRIENDLDAFHVAGGNDDVAPC